jgi:hypothetical protein
MPEAVLEKELALAASFRDCTAHALRQRARTQARRVCGRTRGQARARRRGRAGRRPSGADLATNVGRGLALELGLEREESLRDGLLGVAETAEQGDARRQAADHDKHPGAAERAAPGRARRPPKGRARRNGLHPASETHHGRQRINTMQASRATRVHVAARMSQRVAPPLPRARLTPGGPSPSGVYADVIILVKVRGAPEILEPVKISGLEIFIY